MTKRKVVIHVTARKKRRAQHQQPQPAVRPGQLGAFGRRAYRLNLLERKPRP